MFLDKYKRLKYIAVSPLSVQGNNVLKAPTPIEMNKG